MPAANSPHPIDFSGFLPHLQDLAAQAGLELGLHQAQQMEAFALTLAETNRKFNLTALDQPEDIAALHILDSVLVLDQLVAEVDELKSGSQPLSLVDLGTGAGLPGIPIKVMWPQISLTLVDGTWKKVRFLIGVMETLGLANTRVLHGRAEDLARQPVHRGQYDMVVARGLARLPTLLEYAIPWLQTGGLLLAYKGPDFPAEFQDAQQSLRLLKAEVERVIPIKIPERNVTRRVVVVRKLAATPKRYPRPQGLPRRAPL